jgi:hypothetical protein
LLHQWKELFVVPIHKNGDKTDLVTIELYHCCQLHTKFYPTFFSLGQFHMQMKLLGITNADFDIIGEQLITFYYPSDTGQKVGV